MMMIINSPPLLSLQNNGQNYCKQSQRKNAKNRNDFRSAIIQFYPSSTSCVISFPKEAKLSLDTKTRKSTQIVSRKGNMLQLVMKDDLDFSIRLFHELIHWFHYLVNFNRILRENIDVEGSPIVRFLYPDRLDNLPKIWKATAKTFSVEDLRTIIGTNRITRSIDNKLVEEYHEGDDISENLFICSLAFQNGNTAFMRYGHSDEIASPEDLKETHVKKAYEITRDTMYILNLNAAKKWEKDVGTFFD